MYYLRCKHGFSGFSFSHFRIGILFILFFLVAKINAQQKHEDFAQKYTGMGALSEVIMSHKCIIKNNFNLFYESSIKKTEDDRTFIWYKLVFHQPCFISFTIIPNNENDRYGLEIYKIKNNVKICNIKVDSVFTKVDSIAKDVKYNDNFQSASFRGSLFNSKHILVSFDEVIYILVNNVSGPDLGHVIDLQTCDYSYVLKVNKEQIKEVAEDELNYLRKEYNNPNDRLKSIADKLCDNSNNAKMGYSNFLGDKMSTKNLNQTQLDSAVKVQAQAIRRYDSLAGKPLLSMADMDKKEVGSVNPSQNILLDIKPVTSLNSNTVKDTLSQLKDNYYSPATKTIASSVIKTTTTTSSRLFPGIFIKVYDVATDSSKNIASASIPSFYLKDSIFNIANERYSLKDKESYKVNNSFTKKTKIEKKMIDVIFTVVNATTKKIISKPGLKLYKKASRVNKNDVLIYHDSICSYSTEFLNAGKWLLKSDLFGYLPFEEYFDFNKCITMDDQLYYIILLSPLKKGDKLALPNVFFYPNSIVLKQKSYQELDKLVDYLKNNPVKISINGHTQGNHKINNTGNAVAEEFKFKGSAGKLSKKRAEAVYNYLIEKGIEKERLRIKGYAGRKPIEKHPKNKKQRELNMRVEIKIMDIDSNN